MAVSSSVSAAVAAVQAAVAAAAPLQGASRQALASVAAAVTGALTLIDGEAARVEATIDPTTFGGVVAGVPAPVLVANLLAQTQAVGDLSALKSLRAYLGRIAFNLANAPG